MEVNMMAVAFLIAVALSSSAAFQSAPPIPQSAEELVQALGQFRAALPGLAPGNGVLPPTERLRNEVYDRLWSLGATALPALCRGLADPDVQVRRNVALFLHVAGGDWYDRERPRLAIERCVQSLVAALADSDGRVKELAAQAVGATGAAGAPAVPTLIGLLSSSSEGERNTACIGLAGIGPAAKEALPALKKALSDSSPDVQRFAQRAIDKIEQ
jgi:HEAT repeat protein